MHYLSSLVLALALAASIDARAVSKNKNRRHMDPATMAPAASAAAGSCSGSDPAALNVAGAAATGASPDANAAAAPAAEAGAKAIYFMTNQDENSVIMLPVQDDGTLADGSIIATGGKGASLIDTKTGQPAASDTLASQGSVRVVGSSLFAVNAGSNSLSMFAIDPNDPAKLAPVGQPVGTGGDFPTSVAASASLKIVCVGHTGAAAGISCAKFDEATGLSAFDPLRPFDLKQSNPPTGPLNGIGITFFNEDSSSLITTVKGNPMDSSGAFPGFVSVFAVDTATGSVATEDTKTTPNGTAVLFGTSPIPGTNHVLTTDASFGSATLDLANLAQPVARTALDNQAATCWATVSRATNSGFVTDVGVNHLVEVDLQTGELIHDLQSQNGNPGMIDLQASGKMVYALAPGNGTTPAAVTVFDVGGGRASATEVQNFVVSGADHRAMGMAFA
ncbi:hypothetical protein GJ744_006112 [Endocarpon pusillum]|uniref:3-carboxymuconate cyclase n=1 Tax=Endocarpon pusillum TaxID=364733 RepID=A0A8H7E8G9_9EURO|nr:hypothetical protein GJ744_006112 [Endocarpon pusillum]